MAAVTSCHAEKCCHLINEQEACPGHLCSSVYQLLIYSTSYLFYNNAKTFLET